MTADDFVPAGPVREHLLELRAGGASLPRIAVTAGVPLTTVESLVYGRRAGGPHRGSVVPRIHRETADRILVVREVLVFERSRIPARGAHRRLQALVARGWSPALLVVDLGMEPPGLRRLMKSGTISGRRHAQIADLYERLWAVEPPAVSREERSARTRALRYASKRGWVPPLGWDDIDNDPEPPTVDEPVELVDEVAIDLAVRGHKVRLTPEERRIAVARLRDAGFSAAKAAGHLSIHQRSVVRIRSDARTSHSETDAA